MKMERRSWGTRKPKPAIPSPSATFPRRFLATIDYCPAVFYPGHVAGRFKMVLNCISVHTHKQLGASPGKPRGNDLMQHNPWHERVLRLTTQRRSCITSRVEAFRHVASYRKLSSLPEQGRWPIFYTSRYRIPT